MICHNCGEQIADNSKFCYRCGTPVQPQQPEQNQQYYQAPPQQNFYQAPPQFNQPFNQMPPAGIEKRDIAITIILSLVTCGIYGLVWLARMNDDLNKLSGRTDDLSGGVVAILSLITGGIFGIYWAYKAGEKLNTVKSMRGMPIDENIGIIYMLLNLFKFDIVTYALVQSELNKFADR